jgi:CheY-like chemotaxis protein
MAEPEIAYATTDIRRLIEARLAEVEGMAAVGMLLEGAVHQINNPLASLLISLEQLCERIRHLLPTTEQVEAMRIAEEARNEGERVANAVRELNGLLPSDSPGPVELNDVVLSVLLTLERQLGARVRIIRELGILGPIAGREARLAQVLLSAASLCIDVYQLAHAEDQAQLVVRTTMMSQHARIRFEVADTQVLPEGLRAATHQRRLSLLRGVVQQLGGALAVEDAALTVTLPIAAVEYDSEAQVSLKVRESAPPRGELRILVADDEISIQRALERGLREIGFVQTVTSGKGAIELLEGGATFDVILSDVIMPEGTGIELADWLQRYRPRLKRRLILMTGMGEVHADSHPEVLTVPKPFDLPALRELVCQVSSRT